MILGLLGILYGFVVMSAASGTRFYCVWLLIGAAFIAVSLLMRGGFFERNPAAGKILLAAALIGAAALAVLLGIILRHFGDRGEKNLDYIIVLGAQVRESGPSLVLRHRLDRASVYLEENGGTICIVSGGQGPNEPFSEAEGMKRYLEGRGIDGSRVIMEDRSLDTGGNIANSMKLISGENPGIGIVTNNFHLARALRIAEKKGLENVCGIAAGSEALFLPNNMLRECLAIMKELVLGNI